MLSVKRESFILIILFLLMLMPVYSCKDKDQDVKTDLITGRWVIYDAIRNGRITTTLKDGYLAFGDGGNMETNILGEVVQSRYVLENEMLTFDENFPFNFKVDAISRDSLQLSGKMKMFDMIFFLTRQEISSDSSNLLQPADSDQFQQGSQSE